ncbi:MAG: hypothetical protein IH840_12050 [Candidatus Heimdallarchaeota archaeon]|nr:hypothetical protein [Candidatus Heimdallarchaeota archaeon]
MLKKLWSSRKALSPVLTTMFLMAVILSSIAVALSIIRPALEELNDQIDLDSNSSNFLTLDTNIKGLILSTIGGRVIQSMNLGDGGILFGDIYSRSQITIGTIDNDGNFSVLGGVDQFNLTQYPLIIRESVTSDGVITPNSHDYLVGSDSQNFFYLTTTTKSSAPWTILNQSRFATAYVYTTLSYRNVINTEKTVDSSSFTVNLTISIQRVKFNFIRDLRSTGSNVRIEAEYVGLSVITEDWHQINYDALTEPSFYMIISNTMWDVDGTISASLVNTERPFSHQVPEGGILNVRLQFLVHEMNIKI